MAYRADIEIAVRGAQELKRLQNEVSATSKLVNQLNNYLENIGSGGIVRNINNLRDVVGRAAAAFNEVALGTDEATIAAKKYITATNELNTGLRERAALLKQITEQERKAKLASAGVRETTQYGGPIGPGQASPVALSSQLRGRTQQILDERKGVNELAEALLQLEERRRQETNAALDARAASVALQQERKQEAFLAGKTQFAEPIGPGQASPVALASQLRGRTEQILAERKGRAELNSVLQAQFEAEQRLVNSKLDAKAAKVQQALDQQAAAAAESAAQTKKLADRQLEFTERTEAAARAAKAQTAEFVRQQRIAKQLRAASAQTPAGGFPVEGPMASPGFRGMQRNVGRFGENLALGAGFPLLFGGGAGSVIGSVLGSFVGTGFGGQILGGALGQALDQALIKIKDIGNAIKTLDFNALTESGIRLSTEIQGQLDLLSQVGDTLTAQKILSQEIARETGTLPGVTEDVANSVNILSDSWRKVVNAVSTTVGIIGAPFAVALAAVLEAVNAIFRVLNGVFSLLGKGIKTVGQFVVQLVAGQGALDAINNGLDRMNSGLAEANAQAAQFRSTLNESVVRTSIELSANQALTPGVTSEDKITNLKIEKQKQLDLLFQDEVDARIKIRSENAKATAETVEGLIKQNDVLFKNKKQLIETTAERQITAEIQREQARLDADAARAAEKAARELERQRKEMERMAKLRAQQFTDAQRGFVLAEAGLTVTAAGEAGNEKAKVQAEFDRQRAERMFKYTELLGKALSDEERLTLIATQEVEAEKALIEVTRDLFNIDLKRAELLNSPTALSGAQQELELLAAKIQGKEQEYQLQQKINDLVSRGVPLEDARGIVLTIQDLEKQNKAIEAQKQLWADIYTTVAGELQSALTGLIDGTTQWGDVLSSILGSLGNLFLNAAFTGLGGALKLPGFADGGFVTSPTTAVVGEGGEPEYVIPQSKMTAAMSRYSRGARGESVIPGSGASAEGGGAAAATMEPIDVRYSVERINNVEYVTADQFRAGMAQAAQQGAIQGERRAMRTLTNSAAARGRLGI